MSLLPIPLQIEVCTRPGKAETRCRQYPGNPFPECRLEDPVPARRRESLTCIRLRVNPRSCHQRTVPVLGCIGVRGRMVNTGVVAVSACRPESEPFPETRPLSG